MLGGRKGEGRGREGYVLVFGGLWSSRRRVGSLSSGWGRGRRRWRRGVWGKVAFFSFCLFCADVMEMKGSYLKKNMEIKLGRRDGDAYVLHDARDGPHVTSVFCWSEGMIFSFESLGRDQISLWHPSGPF